MAYSQVGIVNLSLQRIGVAKIASMTEQSKAAISASVAWEYILNEVLEARDWIFAKRRVALAQNSTSPANTDQWKYAYTIPTDFLRKAQDKENDPAIYPAGYEYVFETLADGTLCLFNNYDNSTNNIYLTYIIKITDPAKLSASFINALSFRLAAELALPLTESPAKYKTMMELYGGALLVADEVNAANDYLKDETGNDDWVTAGR